MTNTNTNNYKNVLAETYEILKYVDNDMRRKIPNKLYKYIEEQRNVNYKTNINPLIPLSSQNILKETNDMLAVLYRTYWVAEEERRRLESLDVEELKRQEEILREKYNPDNIFKNSKENIIENVKENEDINKELVDIQNLTIYEKIFIKLKNFLDFVIRKLKK